MTLFDRRAGGRRERLAGGRERRRADRRKGGRARDSKQKKTSLQNWRIRSSIDWQVEQESTVKEQRWLVEIEGRSTGTRPTLLASRRLLEAQQRHSSSCCTEVHAATWGRPSILCATRPQGCEETAIPSCDRLSVKMSRQTECTAGQFYPPSKAPHRTAPRYRRPRLGRRREPGRTQRQPRQRCQQRQG